MKKAAFILIPLVLIVVGYLAYTRWYAADSNPWEFVPAKAALVLENENGLATLDSIKTFGVWSAVSELEIVQRLEATLLKLDSVDQEVAIGDVFEGMYSLVALFPTSAADVDALVILKISNNQQRNFLKRAQEFFKATGNKTNSRNYNGFTIEELIPKENGRVFSFFQKGDVLVGSFTSFLVEDAIRAYNDPGTLSFQSTLSELKTLTPLRQDAGNIYINSAGLGNLTKLFFQADFDLFGSSSFLDVDVKNSSLRLTGFTFPQGDLLSSFSSGPTTFELLEIIPNSTAVLRHFSFENSEKWRAELLKLDTEIKASSDQLQTNFDIDMNFLFGQIKGEMAIAELEVLGTESPDRMVFFDTKDIAETKSFLQQAASRMTNDTVFVERVGDYEIVRLADPSFSKGILGKRSDLTGDCYYLIYRNYVILSNSLAQLKRLIQSIETDNTWKKSLRVNSLLDQANREANYSLLVNVPRSWNYLMNSLKAEWVPFFKSNETGFKSLEYFGLQFSKVDSKFYTNVIAYQPDAPRQKAKVDFGERALFPATIITKPYVIRSHVDQSLEVLIQDSLLQLYHLASNLEILWVNKLNEPIVSAIHPVDFYNNGKVQYAFTTKTQLHILDRNGSYLEGFPKRIPTKNPLAYFSIVDYDGSKNYRFMCTDSEGNIYLVDKTGAILEGWGPKAGGRSMISGPRHIRVAGKDAFIVIRKSSIDLISRKGTSYRGFPLELNKDIAGSYFTQESGTLEKSKLTTISKAGEILRINFEGKIEFTEQLFKPETNSSFELEPDRLDNTYVILRGSDNLMEVLDAGGVKLFEKSYVNSASAGKQYYRFGGDRTLLLLPDLTTGFLSVFDLQGNSLTQRPLQTTQPASVIYFENQGIYQFYLTNGKTIEKIKLD